MNSSRSFFHNFKTTRYTRLLLIWMVLLTTPGLAHSQKDFIPPTKKQLKKNRPEFLLLSGGFARSRFRDFATSPLFYSGTPFHTSLSHLDMDSTRESSFTLSYARGVYNSSFNHQESQSSVNIVSINYQELFQIQKLSNARINIKVGGQFNSTVNLRDNEQLFNNSEGVDIISTLFGSAKATIDMSRNTSTEKRWLFIRYKAKKRIRKLSLTLNPGLINSSYRNGFAYLSPSAPLNEDEFFSGYEFQVFQGFRLNGNLDYTIFLENRNGIRFSYTWDIYSTGGHHDNFEMATHGLVFTLLYNLK